MFSENDNITAKSNDHSVTNRLFSIKVKIYMAKKKKIEYPGKGEASHLDIHPYIHVLSSTQLK